MECETVLDILTGQHPEANEADWEMAGVHLDACPQCDQQFRNADALDRGISNAMSSVEVPETLLDQIFIAIQNESRQADEAKSGVATTIKSVEDDSKSRVSRRVAMTTIAASLLLGAVCWQLLPNSTPSYTIAEIRTGVLNATWESLPAFENSASVSSLRTIADWNSSSVQLSQPKGYRAAEAKTDLAAVFQFALTQHNQQAITGLLIAVPSASLSEIPEASAFSKHQAEYLRGEQGNFASVSWHEGETTYICLVQLQPGAGDVLERLEQSLAGRPV